MASLGHAVRLVVVLVIGTLAVLGCADDPLVRTEIIVEGMHCDGCEEAIAEELATIEGVLSVDADWESGHVEATHRDRAVPAATLVTSIESLGYTVHGTKTEPTGT
jgi:copper chaperone CopZ